jgi:hypothetical protein
MAEALAPSVSDSKQQCLSVRRTPPQVPLQSLPPTRLPPRAVGPRHGVDELDEPGATSRATEFECVMSVAGAGWCFDCPALNGGGPVTAGGDRLGEVWVA